MPTSTTATSSGPYLAAADTIFNVDFQTSGVNEIRVYKDGVIVGGYVHNRDEDGTGTIVFDEPQSGVIEIISNPSYTQPTGFTKHGAFFPDQINVPLDRLARTQQHLRTRSLEALRMPEDEYTAPLPAPIDRRGKLLNFSEASGVLELLTHSALATSMASTLEALLPQVVKGDPGANAMAVGLFIAGSTMTIPIGTNMIRTSGHSVEEKGGAFYQSDDTVDATYVTDHPNSSFISANGRGFRLSRDQFINVMMFGALGDNVTPDGPAFVEAINWCNENAVDDGDFIFSFGKGTPALYVPPGRYWMEAETLDLYYSIRIYGEGFGGAGGGSSVLRWGPGVTGIRVQRHDTAGADSFIPEIDWEAPGANGSILSGLGLYGAYDGIEGEFHAIHIRAHGVTVQQCIILEWEGDGIFAIGDDATTGGNVNSFNFDNNIIYHCRDGIHTFGNNAQAGYGRNDTSQCRRWGINDESYMNNEWRGISEGCGLQPGTTPTVVSHNGNRYAVVDGEEAGASTHAPSGDETDNQWWYYTSEGDPQVDSNVNIPAWTNGVTYRSGGPIRTTSHNAGTTIIGFYSEIGSGPMQLKWPTLLIGGNTLSGYKGVTKLRQTDLGLSTERMHIQRSLLVGYTEGYPDGYDGSSILDSTGTSATSAVRFWQQGVPDPVSGGGDAYLKNAARQIYGNPKIQFFNGPTSSGDFVGEFDEDGNFALPAGATITINGVPTVIQRQAGIPDNADLDPATINAWVNAILDALRGYGVIEPL